MGYGHWLSNDPRGSGSTETRKEELKELGEIHPGRKRIQPSRAELRAFYQEAEPKLEHPVIWFNQEMRNLIAATAGKMARQHGYTLWAFAILRNHMHALPRTHRDHADVVWTNLANATRDALRAAGLVPRDHPVWSHRPYKVFKYTFGKVRDSVNYINDNPQKEKLAPQHWDFVTACSC
jgi:REP element-mobilizing transposase RayT